MEIETFEVVEERDTTPEIAAEERERFASLVVDLGLTGQQRLLAPKDTGERALFPYKLMTKQEEHVYEACFPVKTSLEKYDEQPIPLRCLQVAAHALTFPTIVKAGVQVWHEKGSKDDPVLVARAENYGGRMWLLARWGSALAPFSALLSQARSLMLARKVKAYDDKIRGLRGEADDLGSMVDAHLAGEDVYFQA